jgi:hypothetical protein
VAGKRATDVLSALRLAYEGNETVLPALRHLHVQTIAGLLGTICRPASTLQSPRADRLFRVTIYMPNLLCRFWRLGRSRQTYEGPAPKPKHRGVFQWSQARNYLLQGHLESEHPEAEVAFTDALILNPDLESFLPFLAQ